MLDYDVFTVHRIFEHRAHGYELRAAIVKGLWETQSSVFVAGLIMGSVFAGLLLSSEPAVNQLGFLLLVSVLFDTFVVQALLFPSIVSLNLGRLAWWPREMPEHGLITLDDPEFTDPHWGESTDSVQSRGAACAGAAPRA